MKKITLIIATLLLSTFANAAIEYKTIEEATKQLAVFTVEDIKGDEARLKEGKGLKIDEMFDALEAAVKVTEKNAPTEDLVLEMERVTLITFLHDPSAFAVSDIILPVYRKHKELFKKAAKQLHPVDRKLILSTLDGQDKALSSDGD